LSANTTGSLLLHDYTLDAMSSDAVIHSTLRRLLKDVRSALDEHGRIAIFIERAPPPP
jgi:hypothetical protein